MAPTEQSEPDAGQPQVPLAVMVSADEPFRPYVSLAPAPFAEEPAVSGGPPSYTPGAGLNIAVPPSVLALAAAGAGGKKRRTFSQFMRKYCCAGQILPTTVMDRGAPPPGSSWFYEKFIWNRPYWVTVVLPLTVVYTVWLTWMISGNRWGVFGDQEGTPGYYLTLTMIFGSFVAGATSEGGGSVAYPIMTLVLGLTSSKARDFSLMIQSVGMTSAAFSIYYSRIVVEHTAVFWCSIGGVIGICVSLEWVTPHIPDAYAKMIFVSTWLAFAINLYFLNRQKKRITHLTIAQPDNQVKAILLGVGIIGGSLSALAGSGIDICTFSVLTLYFRLTEKTATPTSVVLMAGNTVVGFFYRAVVQQGIEDQVWAFWQAAAPAVCVGAPFGAFVSSFLHRQVLAMFVYVTDTTQFIGACALTSFDVPLALTTVVTLSLCLGAFYTLAHQGKKKVIELVATPAATKPKTPPGERVDIELPGNHVLHLVPPLSGADVTDTPSLSDTPEPATPEAGFEDLPVPTSSTIAVVSPVEPATGQIIPTIAVDDGELQPLDFEV